MVYQIVTFLCYKVSDLEVRSVPILPTNENTLSVPCKKNLKLPQLLSNKQMREQEQRAIICTVRKEKKKWKRGTTANFLFCRRQCDYFKLYFSK